MKRRIYDYPFWIGLVSGILTIMTCLVPIFLSHDISLIIACLIIGLVMILILMENIHLKKNWRRRKRYPEIFTHLNNAFTQLNHLRRDSEIESKKKIDDRMKKFCDKIAEAFTIVTGKTISVTIKGIEGDVFSDNLDMLEIKTLFRDTKSDEKRSNYKYYYPLTIGNNSDFKRIAEKLKNDGLMIRHFRSSNLIIDAMRGYKNSRFFPDFYAAIERNPHDYKLIKKIWPLMYKSTIVVAIYPLTPDNKYSLPGFLCIDSEETNVFVDYDLEILYGIADSLYNYKEFLF